MAQRPTPAPGDWPRPGCPTHFPTRALRGSYPPIIAAREALGKKVEEHIHHYGAGIENRLTGLHETAPWNEFSYGVSDRGASVRIPWQVAQDKKGYIEDRRPNANMDPYVVTRLITNTICSDAAGGSKKAAPAKKAAKKTAKKATRKVAKRPAKKVAKKAAKRPAAKKAGRKPAAKKAGKRPAKRRSAPMAMPSAPAPMM